MRQLRRRLRRLARRSEGQSRRLCVELALGLADATRSVWLGSPDLPTEMLERALDVAEGVLASSASEARAAGEDAYLRADDAACSGYGYDGQSPWSIATRIVSHAAYRASAFARGEVYGALPLDKALKLIGEAAVHAALARRFDRLLG